jgi:hypothetical protein
MSELQAILELIGGSVVALGVLGAATNGWIGAAAFIIVGVLCVVVSAIATIVIDIATTTARKTIQ